MAEEPPTINLKILSPSTEVEGGVSFTELPAATTIKELRSRIQDAVPSKPATERMRLIYRGRVVANDADTLASVFGAENIRESKDQSLHLVLRELPPTSSASSSPGPRASTAAPNPFRPAQAPAAASPPLQTNPFRAIPQPRPHSQPPVLPQPHHHHHHPHVHHHHVQGPPNFSQVPLPPAVQQQLAQTLAMAQNAQLNNGQPPTPQSQQPNDDNPAPENGAQAPHMGLPPLPGHASPGDGRTFRQEGFGPNGRWSVTYSSTTIPNQLQQPMLARPFVPPNFGLPPHPTGSPAPTEAIDRLLPRMRAILESARQDMENARILHASGQPSGPRNLVAMPNPPGWRLQRIRLHIQTMGQNLNLVERGLSAIAADASMANNLDAIALRQSANELRHHLDELNRTIGQQESGPAVLQPTVSATAPTPPASAQPGTQTAPMLPSDAPQELFLLSSPQGPVGLLFDQRGTYMTAPMVPTLPFQTFTNQFAQNRQLIAGLGQHIAQSSHVNAQNAQDWNHAQNQPSGLQPTPTQQPTAAGQAQDQAQAQEQGRDQVQNQAGNQDANANQPANPAAENDRMGNIAGHLWLVFKLACFVYFFSGTGWYKSLLLGLIAGGVYLAQLGMFDEHFRVIRQHFEAVLPVGALADRAAQPAQARRNMTPEEAARRLLQQQRDQRFGWVRDSVRTVERSFAIFVASLWPGIGERMVHAQEERIRAERVAEEERQQQAEEERKKREEEARQQQESEQKAGLSGTADVGSSNVATSSAKGKERAEVAPTEGS